MGDDFSIDEKIFSDRKSSFLIKVSGKKKREGLLPGDVLVVDRNLPHEKEKLALVVRKGKFTVERVSEELIQNNDPENGDFIWGMVRALVREVP
jgi:SOS-response transcriptional repressor LexA